MARRSCLVRRALPISKLWGWLREVVLRNEVEERPRMIPNINLRCPCADIPMCMCTHIHTCVHMYVTCVHIHTCTPYLHTHKWKEKDSWAHKQPLVSPLTFQNHGDGGGRSLQKPESPVSQELITNMECSTLYYNENVSFVLNPL